MVLRYKFTLALCTNTAPIYKTINFENLVKHSGFTEYNFFFFFNYFLLFGFKRKNLNICTIKSATMCILLLIKKSEVKNLGVLKILGG